jgi:hypothetical protein
MFWAGTSFWIKHERPPHLWFIVSDPKKDDEHVLYVNVTSLDWNAPKNDPHNDRACIIYAGEHRFITRDSCVYYYGAQVASVAHLTYRYDTGGLTLDDPASPELLAKMQTCGGDSVHLEPGYYDILAIQGLDRVIKPAVPPSRQAAAP